MKIPNDSKLLNEKNNVVRLINNSKIIIRILAFLVGAIFGWLKFRDISA